MSQEEGQGAAGTAPTPGIPKAFYLQIKVEEAKSEHMGQSEYAGQSSLCSGLCWGRMPHSGPTGALKGQGAADPGHHRRLLEVRKEMNRGSCGSPDTTPAGWLLQLCGGTLQSPPGHKDLPVAKATEMTRGEQSPGGYT